MKDIKIKMGFNKGYTNIVMAVPHSVGTPCGEDWSRFSAVAAERDRWTDWLTDELFDCRECGAMMVVGRVSRLDCDLERLEGEHDRLCKYTEVEGCGMKAAPGFSNRMLAEWYRYRSEVLECAATGERPLIIDCHSFPEDLADDVDICIGFNEDESCPPREVLEEVAGRFSEAGYSVEFNRPYSNALAPVGYIGQSLMIEVNKRCYLDLSGVGKGEGFGKLRRCIRSVVGNILAWGAA